MDRYSFQTLGLFVSLLAVSLTACVPVEPPNLQVQSPASASPVTLAVAQQASTSKAGSSEQDGAESTALEKADKPKELAVATFGGGCFWCVEGVFENMKGVKDVVSGYSGGHVVNPTYKQVCYEDTGHAEVCQIHYDPAEVSFVDLMEVFFKTHDPTTLNRQGNDRGPQYRSCIFYHDGEQKALAEKYKKKLDESGAFRSPIVTQIAALDKFYKAEEYHQDYFRKNPGDGYCAAVVRPKVEKFKKVFADKIQEP
ncbi:MAG: peptide-methionine (S)-S-oxide reductase MsrA [Planctomycetales bacterium]|nr:peptide-methionine (S)-S-oxide reductase MsrA [Planctomycetales bacterium]